MNRIDKVCSISLVFAFFIFLFIITVPYVSADQTIYGQVQEDTQGAGDDKTIPEQSQEDTQGAGANNKITGQLQEVTDRTVKVNNSTYYICTDSEINNPEHKGMWVLNERGEEITFNSLSTAEEVKLYILQEKNCVRVIQIIKSFQ